jgi:hypothetical protein
MSKMMADRRKRSTILVSKRTVQDALRRANTLGQVWMQEDQNDPRVDELQRVVDHLSSVINKTPQQMRADGAASIEDYFDDAIMGDAARTLKREVDMIAKWHRAQRPAGTGPTPENQGLGYVPDTAVADKGIHASDKKKADGAGFVTDRDDKGEPKAPEKLEVPRVAAKKKEAVPEAVPAAPVAAPAPALDTKADIGSLSSEALAKAIKALTGIKEFETDKAAQAFIEQMASVLKNRPIEQEEPKAAPAAAAPPGALGAPAAAPAAPLPVAASKKKSSDGSASAESFVKDIPQAEGESALPKHADLGDHAMDGGGDIGGGSGASISPRSPARDTGNPEPSAAPTKIDLGGLSMASADEEGDAKTADDYRIHDYKLQDEGVVPTGKLPGMDEQEERMHPEGEFEKESVAPPHSEEVVHALKKEPGVDNPFAVAWSMHNKGDKMSAVKAAIAAVNTILGNASAGAWSNDVNEKGKIVEDGGNLPEVAEAHAAKDEGPAKLDRPATTAPMKLAADMTVSKALKQSESLGNDLKRMYLDAKSLTAVNDTRPVREAVESIFRSADMFDEATKALNKQQQQEESEAAAQEMKAKNKKSSVGGLALAAAE